MDLAEVAVLEGDCVLVFIATKGPRETRNWKGGKGVFYLSLDRGLWRFVKIDRR